MAGPKAWFGRASLVMGVWAASLVLSCPPGRAMPAADADVALPALPPLAGKTLSAVALASPLPGSGLGLNRLMFQAYLRQDGTASVRLWNPRANAYTQPSDRRWSQTGTTLCLDLPEPGPGNMCLDLHVWGPRIAGFGGMPHILLDGDLQAGNALRP